MENKDSKQSSWIFSVAKTLEIQLDSYLLCIHILQF